MRYFVAKSLNFDSLKKCHQSSLWTCNDRKTPPHPRHVLSEALSNGPVVLIFHVNNCHGWHGYANMLTAPDSNIINHSNETGVETKSGAHEQEAKDGWYQFTIEWQKLYLNEHGEQCLPFSQTEKLTLSDGKTVNKARNYQEIPAEMGHEVCVLIDKHYQSLTDKRMKKLEVNMQKRPPAFFQPGAEDNPEVVWSKLMTKVRRMGKVLLACVFGSQR